MFKLRPLVLSIFTFCIIVLNINVQADSNMIPPKPVDNKIYDAMVGTWTGDSMMMGAKMHDVLRLHWALDHQFLVMGLISTKADQPSVKYEGMGIFGINAQGKATVWWFDSWGSDAVSTGAGQFGDSKLVLTDSNAIFNETRSFEVNGNKMTMHATGTMTWQGKQTPFEQTTIYQKQ